MRSRPEMPQENATGFNQHLLNQSHFKMFTRCTRLSLVCRRIYCFAIVCLIFIIFCCRAVAEELIKYPNRSQPIYNNEKH